MDYRILNPTTGRLERQRIKFQKIRKRQRNDQAARKVGKNYCHSINEALESGWTPYNDLKNSKTFHKLTDVLKAFINDKELDYKNKILRYDSIRTYRSQLSMLLEWISKENESMQVVKFDKEIGQRYLDYVYRTKEVSPRTWNNYLVFLSSCANSQLGRSSFPPPLRYASYSAFSVTENTETESRELRQLPRTVQRAEG